MNNRISLKKLRKQLKRHRGLMTKVADKMHVSRSIVTQVLKGDAKSERILEALISEKNRLDSMYSKQSRKAS